MSEPFLERLSRFTPDSRGLDRDALLFATGRASARPNRGWKSLASALAVTQLFSLVVLWPRTGPPVVGGGVSVTAATKPPEILDDSTSLAPVNSGLWSARYHPPPSENEDRSASDVSFVESGPPLRAFRPLPPSLIN
jgi:hypothetical protein